MRMGACASMGDHLFKDMVADMLLLLAYEIRVIFEH
jgi:hypothetical protein